MAVATLAYRNLSGPGRTTVPSLSGLVWLGVLLLPSLAGGWIILGLPGFATFATSTLVGLDLRPPA